MTGRRWGGCCACNRFQITDASVSENNQVAVSMNVPNFDKPGLLWPLVRSNRFVIERACEIIDTNIFTFHVIRIVKEILNRWADPALLAYAKRFQGGDP